jgi:hypothetical protein
VAARVGALGGGPIIGKVENPQAYGLPSAGPCLRAVLVFEAINANMCCEFFQTSNSDIVLFTFSAFYMSEAGHMHWFAKNEQLVSRFGQGELINGLGKKLEGLCVGQRRHVIVKSEKGFVRLKSGIREIPPGLAMVGDSNSVRHLDSVETIAFENRY